MIAAGLRIGAFNDLDFEAVPEDECEGHSCVCLSAAQDAKFTNREFRPKKVHVQILLFKINQF